MVGLSTTRERSTPDPTSPTLLVAVPVYDEPGRNAAPPPPTSPAAPLSPASAGAWTDEVVAPHPAGSPAAGPPAPHAGPALLTAVPVGWPEAPRTSAANPQPGATDRSRIDDPHQRPVIVVRTGPELAPAESTLLPGLGHWLHLARRSLTASFLSALVHMVALVVLGGIFLRPQLRVEPPPPLEVSVAPQEVLTKPEEPVVVALEVDKPSIKSEGNSIASGQGSAGSGGGRGGGVLGGLSFAPKFDSVAKTSSGGSGFGLDDAYGTHMLGEVGELKKDATFFGVKADGKKFVYVVDTSGSMYQNNRYLRCREELIRSLTGLGYGQKYFVVFFNTNTFPMPERKLVDARAPQLKKTIQWIGQSLPQGFTQPWDGLMMGLRMKPDAIFLLTDGEFSPDVLQKVVAAQPTEKKIPIHTIGFESTAGEQTLQTIARLTGGKYQYVP